MAAVTQALFVVCYKRLVMGRLAPGGRAVLYLGLPVLLRQLLHGQLLQGPLVLANSSRKSRKGP